jgi:hypothetical protein
VSEHEGSQRERGAREAVRPAGTQGGLADERAESEREGSQRKRGVTAAVRPAATLGGQAKERVPGVRPQ